MFRSLRWSALIAALRLAALAGCLVLGTQGEAPAQSVLTGGFQWQTLGARTYDNNCSGCHQRSGRGIAGGFPPLAGHAPDVLAQKGSGFLARLVLFGMTGAIEVEGTQYNGTMPSWEDSLKDDEVAAVIDYVLSSWGNDKKLPADFKPIVPADVAAARTEKLTSEQVYAMREQGAAPRPRTAGIAPSFTEDQAERGHLAYAHNCLDCHGSNLDNGEFGGPPLKGSSFARHWDASSVGALFSFMKAKMPPDRPGQLNDETYTDIITYILSENGYKPTDKELPTDPNAQQAMSLKR
ncbi:MAG TPA: c-type cytochrome [Xanthobacteraceae bacterium]|nr:c-type cytochrome [Xanthobacteraceae bacterium]